jgi:hypothetical protein
LLIPGGLQLGGKCFWPEFREALDCRTLVRGPSGPNSRICMAESVRRRKLVVAGY